MFHKAIGLKFKKNTVLEVAFADGKIKEYDVAVLFDRFPQMKALENRKLFLSGKLVGHYGIIWNDDLDLEVETVYESGELVRTDDHYVNTMVSYAVAYARSKRGITQQELSEKTGIDQSDISKIERGVANPSVNTLERIADALGCELKISLN